MGRVVGRDTEIVRDSGGERWIDMREVE